MTTELSTVKQQLRDSVRDLASSNDDLSNLLVAADIAALFVDRDARLRRFTAAAARVFDLRPSDIGSSIDEHVRILTDSDLTPDMHAVRKTQDSIERSVQARDGRQFIVRMSPYMNESRDPEGVVMTLTEVTALRSSEQELRLLNQTLEERIRDRTRHLLLLHDVSRAISTAPSWDQALYGVLRHICGAEKWQIGYVYLPAEGETGILVPAIIYLESERFQAFHHRMARQISRGEGAPGRVYAENNPISVGDQRSLIRLHPSRADVIKQLGLESSVVIPISAGGETVAVMELLSTSTQQLGAELTHLLSDVGAQISGVIDRERTMSQAAALVWREQQGLVHVLHDSIGQQLTAIGMLSTALSRRLGNDESDVIEVVNEISRQAQDSLEQVRRLSRGLFPVEVEANGLAHALRRLVGTTTTIGSIQCTVEESGRLFVRDNRVATELYRIAQEAVSNALKHADARSIIVRLVAEPGMTIMSISDDGHGLLPRRADEQGVGLRIMRYRAQSIGASLTIESTPGDGTVVTCLLRDTPHQTLPPFQEGSVV